MDTNAFYSTTAQLSFGLLALWWAVIELRHAEWIDVPALRRMSYAVALHFLLPGVMSLLSIVAGTEQHYIWRSVFLVAGVSGVVASISLASGAPTAASVPGRARLGQVLAALLYALVAGVAVVPGSALTAAGLDVRSLQVEAILLSLLLFLGVNIALAMLLQPRTTPPPAG